MSYTQQKLKSMKEDEINIKLLEITIQEEHYFLQEHQNRIKFYTSLITGIVAATFGGLINAKIDLHYYALLVGPVLILAISSFAIDGTHRMFQRYLEAITQRAKIEQILGLTSKTKQVDNGYWQEESIISERHLLSRKKFDSSELFIKHFSKLGYHRNTIHLFRIFQLVGILSTIGLIIFTNVN